MKCKHEYTTESRGILDDGTPVAIHQCDFCGITIPAKDAPAADVWKLPSVDEAAQAQAFKRVERTLFGNKDERLSTIVRVAK